MGFMAHLGSCTNTVAELQAIRYGLELAWVQGFRRVICDNGRSVGNVKSNGCFLPCGIGIGGTRQGIESQSEGRRKDREQSLRAS